MWKGIYPLIINDVKKPLLMVPETQRKVIHNDPHKKVHCKKKNCMIILTHVHIWSNLSADLLKGFVQLQDSYIIKQMALKVKKKLQYEYLVLVSACGVFTASCVHLKSAVAALA